MSSTTRQLCFGTVSSSEIQTSAAARFATALADSLSHRGEIARIQSTTPAPRNAHPSVSMASPRPLRTVAVELNRCDVAIIHHSGDDELADGSLASNSTLLDVVELVDVPTIVVLHHVPAEPTGDQRRALAQACRSADAVVVTAAPAGIRLASAYGVDPSALWLVRGGPMSTLGPLRTRRPTVVTWGVMAPGSGIEWMIDAMVELSALDVRYLVAGPSSDDPPADTQRYHDMLVRRCWSHGLPAYICLGYDDADQTAMTETLRSALAVIVPQDLPGDNTDGYFEEIAVAALPIVATDDATASGALSADTVVPVPSRDPAALADAVLRIMIDPHLAESIGHRAARRSPPTTWAGAAQRFGEIADAAIGACSTGRARSSA